MLKDDRMEAIYSLVRHGTAVCDIGTDHAFIPLELVKNGICPRAVITDISKPSLLKGEKNVEKAGLTDKFSAFHANGTLGADIDGVSDFIIAGMGGEMISAILSNDERLHKKGLRFILQPMTKAEELRKYLASAGFKVITEKKAEADGRIYTVILTEFTGEKYEITEAEAYVGRRYFENAPLETEYVNKVISALTVRLDGLKRSAIRSEEEALTEALIEEIKRSSLL